MERGIDTHQAQREVGPMVVAGYQQSQLLWPTIKRVSTCNSAGGTLGTLRVLLIGDKKYEKGETHLVFFTHLRNGQL